MSHIEGNDGQRFRYLGPGRPRGTASLSDGAPPMAVRFTDEESHKESSGRNARRRNLTTLAFFLVLWGVSVHVPTLACQTGATQQESAVTMELTQDQAGQLANLALKGLDQEYPNKPNNVLAGPQDLLAPREMYPAFYGCFDWHSSVHGHWMLIRLLKTFPELPAGPQIRERLAQHLTLENIEQETRHFQKPENKGFERLYGWAWYLRLVGELETWDDPQGRQWRANLRPLEDHLVAATLEFLPKQAYPIRTGVHPNTAFGLAQIRDYAVTVDHTELRDLIDRRALDYFGKDRDYPIAYEPSGEDFFSPALNEADLMRRVLSPEDFERWLADFLPNVDGPEMEAFLTPVAVTDITDGKLVHLAGLNFNRAWTLNGMIQNLPPSPRRTRLELAAARHTAAGWDYVFTGDYAGEHWLGTFAVYVLTRVGY